MKQAQRRSASESKMSSQSVSEQQTLRLEHVKKYYGNHGNITKAVDGISLHVDKGEFVAVMGASGSGKTTLLNCIAAIDSVTSGHIFVGGQDITAVRERNLADFRRENLGFIFQDFNLLDTLTIGENISMAQIISGASPEVIDGGSQTSRGGLASAIFLKSSPARYPAGRSSAVPVRGR